MKRGLVIICVFFILILSLSFISAGFFSDIWNKITGKAVEDCTDSDGGLAYYVRGTARGPNGVFTDSCVEEGGSVLREFSCSLDERVVYLRYTCPGGSTCSEGVCGDVCVAETCASLGYECGTHDDGCGGSLDCDVCPSGEICSNGKCIEEGQGCVIFYLDADGDSYGVTDNQCLMIPSYESFYTASQSGDCDDTDPGINPLAIEICDDSLDNNCDGNVDEGCVVEGEEEIIEEEEEVEGAEEITEGEIEDVLGEGVVSGGIPGDLDGDGILDIHDPDKDGDGVLDIGYQGISANGDLDGDGILNIDDDDIDGDGILNGFDVGFSVAGTIDVIASTEPVVSEEVEDLERDLFREDIIERGEGGFVQQGGIPFKGYMIELEDEPLAVENVKLEEEAEKNEGNFLAQVVGTIGLATTKSNIERKLENKREDLEDKKEDFKKNALDELGKTSVITGNAVASEKDLVVLGEYENVFNGLALDISPEEAEEIKKIKGVKSVSPNYMVNITLMDSVPLINADDTWQLDANGENCEESGEDCLTGKGVTIGIIDTGVDYTHGDLGGCFGRGCKVVGGYDFSDNDNDPMDDNGHGTHVAATAAGNGILKGVAPDAQIYAYKVLDSYGGGWSNDIMAAIERSMDPNQDGDFSDHLDIISLSLGGRGNPDDPMSQAIDNAVDAGVVAIVAAGNDGPGEGTIGSPGTARKAITIGASYERDYGRFVHETCTDENARKDDIACFSSRGPVIWEDEEGNTQSLVKPDIVAPGVNICAAQASQDTIWQYIMNKKGIDVHCLDTEHISISGTSMATPIVSGAVALLLQKNPDWTPEEVKAALKATAVDLGEDVNTQGDGRIDVLDAVELGGAPPIAEIETGGEASGVINIIGTASGRDFDKYTLYYGIGENPNEWIEITSSSSVVENNVLYSGFYTSLLNEGYNSLRLLVWNNDGERSKDRSLINVNNVEITYPLNNDILRLGDILDILGNVQGNFDSFNIEWKKNKELDWSSEGITLTNLGTSEIVDDILATFDTNILPTSGYYDIRVSNFIDGRTNYEIVESLYFDSTLKKGWPVRIEFPSLHYTLLYPVIYDINNDSHKEIIIFKSGNPAKIEVYKQDGSLLWRKDLVNQITDSSLHIPLVTDIDNDGYGEIIISDHNPHSTLYSYLSAFNHDGSLAWSVEVPKTSQPQISSADLDLDGNKEIILKGELWPLNGREKYISIINNKGQIISQWIWPFEGRQYFNRPNAYPVVGNFDNDSELEIVIASSLDYLTPKGVIYIYNMDGSVVDGWPIYTNGWIDSAPSVGDIDKDGHHDLVVGMYFTEISIQGEDPNDFGGVYAFDRNGNILPGWPVEKGNKFMSIPALGDIDSDGYLEIAISDGELVENERSTHVFRYNGVSVTGWPQETIFYSDFMPLIADVNGDNIPDVINKMEDRNYREQSGIYAWDFEGHAIKGFPKRTEWISRSIITIEDIDNDGQLELIAGSDWDWDVSNGNIKNRGSIYVWDLDAPYNPETMEWPMFQHDSQHTGLYVPYSEEICDGLDNDRDGDVDEDCEEPCTPTTEICDGKDNDCDEEIDEEGVCVEPCTPTTEICDGKDNDCDEEIDEEGVCVEPPTCEETDSSCYYDESNGACVDCSAIPATRLCGGLPSKRLLERNYKCVNGRKCSSDTELVEVCDKFCSDGECGCFSRNTKVTIFSRNNCCNEYTRRTDTDYGRCRWRLFGRGDSCGGRRWRGKINRNYCK